MAIPVTQLVESTKQWTMPVPSIGTPVLFYEESDTNQKPSFGHIVEVHSKTVTLRIVTVSGFATKRDVSHRDDPALKMSNERRFSGSWEVTPEVRRMEILEDRLDDLERRMSEVGAPQTYPPPEQDQWDADGTKPRRRGRRTVPADEINGE